MAKANLTAERLREIIHYDPETGHVTWAKDVMGGHQRAQVVRKAGTPAGTGCSKAGYRMIGIDYSSYYVHRLVFLYMTGGWPAGEIDHIDGDKDNLRWANLRDVPPKVNKQNNRTARGAYLHKSGLWHATIHANGKKTSLGYYKTAEEARAVYIAAKRRLHEGCTI